MGIPVKLFSDLVPTPYIPFSVCHFKAKAGIMITASHNPKNDNGYKVYWENGAQVSRDNPINLALFNLIWVPDHPTSWQKHSEVYLGESGSMEWSLGWILNQQSLIGLGPTVWSQSSLLWCSHQGMSIEQPQWLNKLEGKFLKNKFDTESCLTLYWTVSSRIHPFMESVDRMLKKYLRSADSR